MTVSGKPVQTAKGRFIRVVESKEVTDAVRRAQLAENIRNARDGLKELTGIGECSSGSRCWTDVQKEIHEMLAKSTDAELKQRAAVHTENLLDAEAELIEGNLRLVLVVVRRYTRRYMMGALEEMDFVQEGCEGLLDAVRRFDFKDGRGFLTYAVIRIRKYVLLAMEKQQRLVRLPSHAVKKSICLKKAIDDFAGRNGRFPMPSEIEEETGGSVDWTMILSLTETVLPMHLPAGENGIPLYEQLSGGVSVSKENGLDDVLEEALYSLDKRSKFVLIMRYGLMDGERQTLETISQVLGLSIERTRQIEKAAINLLRDSFSDYSITDWLQG